MSPSQWFLFLSLWILICHIFNDLSVLVDVPTLFPASPYPDCQAPSFSLFLFDCSLLKFLFVVCYRTAIRVLIVTHAQYLSCLVQRNADESLTWQASVISGVLPGRLGRVGGGAGSRRGPYRRGGRSHFNWGNPLWSVPISAGKWNSITVSVPFSCQNQIILLLEMYL